jgi:hypothetical protein
VDKTGTRGNGYRDNPGIGRFRRTTARWPGLIHSLLRMSLTTTLASGAARHIAVHKAIT